jgi:molybdenum cofactor biosynthesis enzyme MoaA
MSLIHKKEYNITMPFYEIRISVTGACNQNCIYCGPFTDGKYNKGYKNLSLLQIKKLAVELKEIINKLHLHVQLTGGEPMLRNDLPEIVSILRNQEIKDIGITTNGSLINPKLSLLLIKSGLLDFHIHVPSLNLNVYEETVRKKIYNERIKNILDSAKVIMKNGARVEFNTPVTYINLPTLVELFNFCYDNHINLKLIEELNINNSQVSVEDIKNLVTEWINNKKINIVESVINKKYGLIYQFSKNFFFRIAPISPEFKIYLKGGQKKILLDGRYWLGGRNGKFLYTPSYYTAPKEGSIEDIKKQIKNISNKYNFLK